MKTETQIAKENVKNFVLFKESYEGSVEQGKLTREIVCNRYNKLIGICGSHLASCQRFLDKDSVMLNWINIVVYKRPLSEDAFAIQKELREKLTERIEDLLNAIKTIRTLGYPKEGHK